RRDDLIPGSMLEGRIREKYSCRITRTTRFKRYLAQRVVGVLVARSDFNTFTQQRLGLSDVPLTQLQVGEEICAPRATGEPLGNQFAHFGGELCVVRLAGIVAEKVVDDPELR